GGVWLVLRTDGSFLVPVVILLMAAMTLYVLLRPNLGADDRPVAGAWRLAAMALAALLIGTYDGILGPGTGSFLLISLVGFLAFGFRKAAALGRVLNLASNVAALSYFAWAGHVDWAVGLPMAASMAVGGWVGSHTTLRHGDRVVKPLFVAVTLALMVRLSGGVAGWW
ncbi:MAG TPA: TSUP family transporter, partial [Candidatus Thermoplasmatota archaeon]|nr:TSUP family transporter [Candidatus Thermoplasmatota archaeon]